MANSLIERAYEVVHHDAGCPAIGGAGDQDCKCDAVPFLRDLEKHLSSESAASPDRLLQIGLRVGAVADAVFPHNHDMGRRQNLAMKLVELCRLLDSRGEG